LNINLDPPIIIEDRQLAVLAAHITPMMRRLMNTKQREQGRVAKAEAAQGLGCAFHFVFRFLTGLIFWNPRNSADYFQFCGTHVRIKSFQGKINLFRNPTESGIWPEFRGEGPFKVPRVTNIQLTD